MKRALRLKIVERFGNQAAFASAVSEDESVISRVLHGRKQLKAERQARWAKALNCKPEDIFDHSGVE